MSITKAWAARGFDNGSGDPDLVSGTFDSTGYTHLVVVGRFQSTDTTITWSDNKGSSGWSSLTKQSNGAGSDTSRIQMAWVEIGTPGTGHVVTMTLGGLREWRGLHVWVVNATGGEMELVAESTATGVGTAIDAGSLATGSGPTVSFMSVAPFDALTYTAGSGWTADYNASSGLDASYAQSRSDSSGTIDPVCTGSVSMDWATVSATFREPGSGGAGGSSIKRLLTLGAG